MSSETICEICSQILSSPTTLACCSSSVCLDCLKKISVKETRGIDRLSYKCPLCSKEQQSYSSAKPNTFLARYIEFCYKSGKLQNLTCGKCQIVTSSSDTVFCKDCGNKHLCKECNTTSHNGENTKSHNRIAINGLMRNYAGSLNKPMFCSNHFREKIEFICLKDLNTLCRTCTLSHKRNCKESKIVSLEKAHSELVALLSAKIGQVNNYRSMVDGEYSTLQKKLENFNKGSEKVIRSIEDQFQELRDILDAKEKEVKMYFTQVFSQRKNVLTQEIQGLENVNSKTESLIDVVEFAMSYPTSFFSEGAKYLVQRLNRLNEYAPKIESARTTQIPNFDLSNIESCKDALEQLCLKEISNASQNKYSHRSRSIVLKDGSVSYPDSMDNPLTPRLENYSILQDPKKKISHMKKSSLTTSYTNLLLAQKTSSSPDTKALTSQRSFTQLPIKTNSYKNLLSKLGSYKDQKENIVAKTETPQSLKTPKERPQTSGSTLTHSRRPSKSPNFKSTCLKSWAESPKVRITSSEDFGWTLNLSPHSKEEYGMSEEDLQLIAEMQKDPIVKRKFMKISQTANSIFVAWQHSSELNNIAYQLDYGVGSKVQNVEQFRTAFKGTAGSFIISGLLPKTKYRLRVCPILIKEDKIEDTSSEESTSDETVGPWSDIISVTTKDLQAFDILSMGTHATTSLQGKDNIVDFEKSGRVIAKNEYEYGKTAWEIKIPQHIAHQSPVDSNSFIKVGVTNKNGKAYNILGSLINYGLSTDSIVIKVFLDADNRSMIVYSSHNKTKEIINNLPAGPLYPVFQNKTSKDSNFPLKLSVKFDLPYTPNDIKELE